MQHNILGSLESAIMEVVWKRGNVSVRDVLAEVGKKRDVAYTTVMTVMNRLTAKKVLARKPQGNAFVYHPLKNKEDFHADASKRVIDALIAECGGVAIAQFVDRIGKIDPEMRKKLKELIDEDV